MSTEQISDRLPEIDVDGLFADMLTRTTGVCNFKDAFIFALRDAVLAERRRILSRIDVAIKSWQKPEMSGQFDGTVSEWVVMAFTVFRSCITHAGITREEAIGAITGMVGSITSVKPDITVEGAKP